MKVILIEDEPLVAKKLINLLAETDKSLQVEKVIQSVEEAVAFFRTKPTVDLVFMDIQLGDGVSFEIFDQVEIVAPIIFTTAYNEYAIRAFKVNSVDYLLKPIDKAELTRAIEKWKRLKEDGNSSTLTDLQKLMQQLATPTTGAALYRTRMLARHAGSQMVIEASDILYFKKETLIYIVTADKKEYVTDYNTMEELEEVLDPKFFFRANRQTIVHINAVESFKIDHYGKLLVKLKTVISDTVDVSREKAAAFKAWLG